MSETTSFEEPVTFDDVAVYFSEDEWNLLNDQQRALYMEVMKDNYEHFIFLGYDVPVILSLLQDGGMACPESQLRISSITGSYKEGENDFIIDEKEAIDAQNDQNMSKGKKRKRSAKSVTWEDSDWQNGIERSDEDSAASYNHGRNLRQRRQYYCSECERCFKHSSALEAHRRVHNGDKPHQCDICKVNFGYKSELIVHRRQHVQASTSRSQDEENQSPIVGNQIPNRAPVTAPIRSGPSPIVNSQTPNASGQTSNCAVRTLSSSPKPGATFVPVGDKPLKCNFCEKRFNDQSILEAHHRIHTGKLAYPCTMCEESFSKPSLLAAHNNTHKEGKPYQCDQCDKNFNDQALLVAHKRTHTGEKPHKCSHCNKWFPNRTSLVAHEECHLKPKPYKCKHCEKSFNDKNLLITHEGVHTDTKPFKCTQCNESFFLKTQLVSHQATHAPDKPYPCSLCERSFNKKETLLAHIRVHNVQSVQVHKPRKP
ncbi:zinc finger protein 135 [Bombina bombina]|uniref:zinc finger protein 135 n=1 Tax=Bombina bombina TaxID=8345 RepID=UPI00235B2EB4|nr:zinc finger protein 135 [Bombina bombina]